MDVNRNQLTQRVYLYRSLRNRISNLGLYEVDCRRHATNSATDYCEKPRNYREIIKQYFYNHGAL